MTARRGRRVEIGYCEYLVTYYGRAAIIYYYCSPRWTFAMVDIIAIGAFEQQQQQQQQQKQFSHHPRFSQIALCTCWTLAIVVSPAEY